MNPTPAHNNGATSFGATWCTGALLAIAAMLASLFALASPTTQVNGAEPIPVDDVGVLGTSMIEMLGSTSSGTAVTLNDVRQLALQNISAVGDGSGIDVALIDTGVSPVDGFSDANLIHGPDLSFEAEFPQSAYLDTYGHGTHMAGIIAGNRSGHQGVAPGARVVSVKVSGHDGFTTVPQVVAAIDWVVEHRNTDGLNIRVLNLSLGQQGVSVHVGDMLSAAVERAWSAGIFVVVAAGNDGDVQSHLDSPAIDPYVFAVGAADSTSAKNSKNFDVPDWSGTGNGVRNPDLVAPGRSIASYRVPGSTVDTLAPLARTGVNLFKGSGSSQAAAATSGVAAAMLSSNPSLSNDDLKATLMGGTDALRFEEEIKAGEGFVDAAKAAGNPVTDTQNHATAAGEGTGIITPTGATWSGGTWSGATWSGATWSGATWSGNGWGGTGPLYLSADVLEPIYSLDNTTPTDSTTCLVCYTTSSAEPAIM